MKPRNLSGSLEQANDELRDAYMNYKEISGRCTIDFAMDEVTVIPETVDENQHKKEQIKILKTETGDESISDALSARSEVLPQKAINKRVFYFKPESIMMAHPDV